ncbi:MAG TPA: beta-hydroxydecanoyl-ACP dehydratase [Anaerolineaceae bacterium]
MAETEFPTGRLLKMLGETAQRSSALHQQFLQARRTALLAMQQLIEQQIAGSAGSHAAARPALFDSARLDEFGVGQISRCLGPAFARYDQRCIPRIPNGDLKMMSRITAITGRAGDWSQPASVVAEYDVPVDSWYLRDNSYPEIPASLYMEIALQPCGFLSAYLDTYALVPYDAFYFRNLDGSARVEANVDVRGQTIITQARMLTSVASSGTVVQKFAFELSCQGQVIYAGESTFGYFSTESMANQVGLDGGRSVAPLIQADPAVARQAVWVKPLQAALPGARGPYYRPAQGRMNFVDEVAIAEGGRYGKGYLYARRAINPQDWFYPFHFYQDPVMPGSLGVEAIIEAMRVYGLVKDLGSGLRSPRFGPAPGAAPMTWRYRGQITQQHKQMELEVHLSAVDRRENNTVMLGDASLWVDGLRIYELKNVAVGILEA